MGVQPTNLNIGQGVSFISLYGLRQIIQIYLSSGLGRGLFRVIAGCSRAIIVMITETCF